MISCNIIFPIAANTPSPITTLPTTFTTFTTLLLTLLLPLLLTLLHLLTLLPPQEQVSTYQTIFRLATCYTCVLLESTPVAILTLSTLLALACTFSLVSVLIFCLLIKCNVYLRREIKIRYKPIPDLPIF